MTDTAIVCIGTELLEGRVDEQNADHLGELSTRSDLELSEIRTLPDDREAIERALEETSDRQLVVVSGGLGPTDDDVTRRAAADFASVPLREDDQSLQRLRDRFERRGRDFTDNNRRQCRFPEGAEILVSEVGTADGFHLQIDSTDYYFFPGVPDEFRWFAGRYLPVQEAFSGQRLDLALFGRGESDFETMLGDLPERARARGVELRFRATFPIIELTLVGPTDPIEEVGRRVRSELGDWVVAEGDESLAGRLGDRLSEAGATVSVAESCTAGLMAAGLTCVSGSSDYFEEGYLTYSNEAKRRLVNVDEQMLVDHGAVSPQVGAQMAAGARDRSGADYALAITGIAGPTGGTPDKPVGTVDVALAAPDGVRYRRCRFPDRSRREVRILSVHTALAALLWHLEDRLGEHGWSGPASYRRVRRGVESPG